MRKPEITTVAALLVLAAFPAAAQDSKSWLEAQGLEAGATKTHEEFEAMVARVKGAKDAASAQERVVVFAKGKLAWQSNPKENEPAAKWGLHALGTDLDGDGKPEMHISGFSGGANCCTTHYVYKLKPQVRRHAAHPANHVGGGEFVETPGRKTPIMVSADDSSANAFGPYSSSYFPAVILEVSSKGRFQFAIDLMRSKLPGQPPAVCAQPVASANPWLKERCGEYTTARRVARINEIKSRLAGVKQGRAAEQVKWDDYVATGVLAAMAAEVNRYTYTGHGTAGMGWLETVWAGNEPIKLKFVAELRKTWTKSVFAADLRALGAGFHQ